ncbi:type III secretion system chaperone family protein [Henriciella litoralis]|uniref:YbjN domain-containing protein n=1 Tax=Henriciella litoralis TaxID=568102 RepID=UPI0009FEE331|nr:YbjN domain-containing protein [Henriciella litoralis]
MNLNLDHARDVQADPLDLVEACLENAGWEHQRDEDTSLQCIAQSRWGEMGALFASRREPPALHFTVTLDLKPTAARANAISKLVLMANERLWLGHFDYWMEDNLLLFRHTIPMLDRDEPEPGEIRAVLAAATDAVNMFVPAFNFVIWAGKTPEEAIDGAMFETDGEA